MDEQLERNHEKQLKRISEKRHAVAESQQALVWETDLSRRRLDAVVARPHIRDAIDAYLHYIEATSWRGDDERRDGGPAAGGPGRPADGGDAH